jgi:two-component system, LytTR family, response regulator
MKLYRTLIVDDEPPARLRLNNLLANYPTVFEIIGEAQNEKQALELIHQMKPDLIFLDIQMPDMSGFELLQQLTQFPLVVFCTAFDEYALKAFETNSVDYLLKPVKAERLENTISKLKNLQEGFRIDKLMALIQELTEKQRQDATSITIRNGNKMTFIPLEEVAYFMASDKYVSIYNRKGKEYLTNQTIKELESKLPNYFLRIHRSCIVNTMRVKDVHKYLGNRFKFSIEDYSSTKLISGRSFFANIKIWMDL